MEETEHSRMGGHRTEAGQCTHSWNLHRRHNEHKAHQVGGDGGVPRENDHFVRDNDVVAKEARLDTNGSFKHSF